jgi:hypothetical protein
MRPAWYAACEDGPPYPYYNQFYDPVRNPMTKEISEVEYRGRRIVANAYTGAFDKSDTMGFNVPVAFVVLDEFDDPALPLIQQWFWTPHDASAAIRFVDWVTPRIAKDKKNWPTTIAYEYNMMVAYRRNFDEVYGAIKEIEKMCIDARDFDDDMTAAVLSRLQRLRQVVAEGR